MKLIHKLILGFLAVALLSSVSGYFAMTESRKVLQESFANSTETLAHEILDALEDNIAHKILELQGYTYDFALQNEIEKSNREFEKLDNIKSYINNKDVDWASVPKEEVTPFMKDLINKRLSEKFRDKIKFYESLYGHNVFGEIFATNKYGANIAQSGKTSDYRQDDEEWWKAAKKDDLYIGDVDHDESADMYSIDFAFRIEDEDYEFLGVLKVVLNIDDVFDFIKKASPGGIHKNHQQMSYKVITHKGRLIYSSKGDHEFLEDISSILPAEHLVDRHGEGAVMPGLIKREHDGHEVLIAHAHSTRKGDFAGLGWILIVEQDTEELFAPVIELRNRILATSTFVALLGILIGLLISNSISKRIKKLRDAVVEVGSGKLNAPIEIETRDEIGELAAEFRHMTDSLKQTTVARDELIEEINRRELAEEAVNESEDRFRSVAENASDAIIYIDSRGEIIFWNNASEKSFGYSAEEMVGRPVSIIVPNRFRQAHQEGVYRASNNGAGVGGKVLELVGLHKNGKEFPIELSLSNWNVRDEKFFTAIIRDISDRKHTEGIIQEQIGRLNALRSIDRAIIASLDLNVTLDVFLTQVVSELKIDAASVLLLNKYTQTLEHVVSKGFRSNALKYTRLRLGESNAGRAAMERRIVTIPNLRENLDGFATSKQFSDEGFITYFAIPLTAKGEVKGVMELFHREYFEPEPGWFEFLEAIADQGAIAVDNSTLFNDLQRSNIELSLAYDTTIEGWARALDLRDKETEGHSRRVTELSIRIANEFRIDDKDMVHIRRGALLHDIGKMGIPDSILLKPGKLDEEEWKIMKLHPAYARDLLYPVEYLRPSIDIPYYHHERWDGTGYPEGLKGDKIPLSARIFAVVDVWDALRSDRPYRPAWPKEKVIDHIRSQVGSHFDAGVIEVFLSMDLY
jgi:PAS domain S-box-containing protein